MRNLRSRIDRILLSSDVVEGLESLQEDGTLTLMFPELAALVGFGGEGTGHKDLWGHTKQVVAQTKNRALLRWAALFHDVGKPRCFSTDAQGKISFHHHEIKSAQMFSKMAARTNIFTPEEAKEIRFLIEHLGHIESYETDWTDSAVRRVHRMAGRHFDGLMSLARADITTKHAWKREQHHERMKNLRERAEELARLDAIVPALPKGLGDVLTQEFGIPPSEALGDLMKALKALVEAGKLERQANPQVLVDYIRQNPNEFPGVTP